MGDVNTGAAEGGDQKDAIAKLFGGGGGGETKPVEGSGTAAAGEQQTVEPPEQFQAGRLPKQFAREDGKHDYDGLSKSWFDTRAALSAQQARVKELEGQLRTTDEPWEAYSGDFDWDAVKERAPNAYTGGGADNDAAMSLLRRLHDAGVPKSKAAKAVADYYADLDKIVGETPAEDEQRKAAVSHLGTNGPAMAQEVRTALESRAAATPFKDDELEVLDAMTRSGPGLSILWRLTRAGASSAPPTASGNVVQLRDPETLKAEARKGLGVSDEDWRKNKYAAIAAYADAHGIDPSELRGA